MSWITPKTNWVPTDYINYTDFNRLITNLLHVKSMAESLNYNMTFQQMTPATGYSDIPDFEEYNNIENNLATLNTHTYNFNIGQTQTFYVNDPYIDYVELNRIESATLKLYTTLQSELDMRQRLAFTLGRSKILTVVRE